jgi:anti-sigma factor RsiW
MDCNQVRALAPRFIRNGFSGREGAAVEAHVNACTLCQEQLEAMPGEPVLRPHAPYFEAPPALRERVTRALDGATASSTTALRTRLLRWKLPEWLKLGVVSFATAVVTAAVLLPARLIVADDTTAGTLIASHVRWSRLDKLIDVSTSDRHTVKPWLSQKLGYSPAVPDLRDAEFNLIGGRIDYVEDRFVGTVVYKRREHVIDVYVWPDATHATAAHSMSHNGYHVVKWSRDDMTYWAVSDLNADELKRFADLYAHGS